MRFSVLFLSCAAGLAAALHPRPALAEEPIVVTASRTPTQATAATAARSIVTEEDLARRQTVFALDALASLPGVTVSQTGAFGGVAALRLRGLSASQTLVLIDGVPVGDASSPDGAYNPASLDTASLAEIEVLRGPQSTAWGSSALGGVVSITTRRPGPGVSARGFLEAGSFGLGRAGGGLGFGGERFDLRLDASAIGADGISKADERDGNPETDGYDGLSLSARGGWTPHRALRLEAFGRRTETQTAFDSFGFATGVADGPEEDETTAQEYGLQGRLSWQDGRLQTNALLARAEIERESRSAFGVFATAGERDIVRLQTDWRALDALSFSFGADREDQAIEGGPSARIDGAFVLVEATPSPAWTLSVGVRRDDHSRFGEVTTARAGLRFAPSDAFGLRASFGQGFKAPTVFQLTSAFGALPPNTALRPEEAEGWDAAVFGELFDARLAYEIGVFDISVRNQIDFDFTSSRYENIARVDSRGVEASASLAVTPTLTAAFSYTFIDAEDAAGAPLERIPEHTAFAELDWRPGDQWGLTLSLRHNGEEPSAPRLANPSGRLDGWTRADLAARYALTPQAELYARVENLTDEDYQDVFGYGTPGRSVFGGIRVRL